MDRTRNSSRNIICGIVNKVILAIFGFTARTVILRYMGNEYLGLTTLFNSVLDILSVSELGLSSAIIFSLYKPIALQQTEQVCKLLAFYKKCYLIIGGIIVSIGVLIIPFLTFFIKGSLPKHTNIYILYIFNLLNLVIGYFMFSYKNSIIIAAQRYDIISNVGSILFAIQSCIQIIVIIIWKNYYLYVLVTPIITVMNNYAIFYITNRRFPSYVAKGKLDKKCKDSIRDNVKGLFLQKIGTIVLSSSDNLVISAYMGLEFVGRFGNYTYILSFLFMVLNIITSAIQASVGNSVAMNSIKKNKNDFIKFNFFYWWLVAWMGIAFLCLVTPFMHLWGGKDNVFPFYIIFLMTISFYTQRVCEMIVVYKNAAGIWDKGKWVPLCSAVVNLISNIVLIQKIGISGVMISTIVSLLFINTLGYVYILYKYYFKDRKDCLKYFGREAIYFVCFIVAAGVSYCCCGFVKGNNVVKLMMSGVICIFIPNFLFFIMTKNFKEQQMMVDFIKKNIKAFMKKTKV